MLSRMYREKISPQITSKFLRRYVMATFVTTLLCESILYSVTLALFTLDCFVLKSESFSFFRKRISQCLRKRIYRALYAFSLLLEYKLCLAIVFLIRVLCDHTAFTGDDTSKFFVSFGLQVEYIDRQYLNVCKGINLNFLLHHCREWTGTASVVCHGLFKP